MNLEIVRQGHGHAYTQFPFKHMELFRYYGNWARTAGKGLYGVPQARVTSLSEASTAVESEGEVYVTRTGKKYHREGCISLRRSKIPISLAGILGKKDTHENKPYRLCIDGASAFIFSELRLSWRYL